MLIFKDLISGDEMFSDNYVYKLVDNVVYEVYGKFETRRDGEIVLAGSNPSEEEPDDPSSEAGSVSGVDIVLNHRLVETHFDRKGYSSYLKEYMKKLVAKLALEEVDVFKTNIQSFMKEILVPARFKDLQFWTGENMDVDGMIGLMEYREIEGTSRPVMMFFKHGLVQEKY